MTEPSDVELVRRFQNGDVEAFEALVRRSQDRVYRIALVSLFDSEHAADVAQEVFCRAYTGLKSFRFGAEPFTWIYRATKNVCREFNRKRRTEPLDEEPHDRAPAAAQQIATDEDARQVRSLVASLPERQREVVVLRVFEELSVAATAAAMGCRQGTVKALLHKAMLRLRLDAKALGLEQ